ncbi:MAG: hypothetical protein GMKNLPBB_03106 [Myxococcota bacterium]|nr:hypothetical protein [Myxococcota bacterium]
MTKSNSMILAAVMILAAACEESAQPASSAVARAKDEPAISSSQPAAPPAMASSQPRTGPLTLVSDRSLVCMVNNRFMGRPQIPVTVGSNTYYGCCEMCKGRLANDPASRTAIDPVSRRPVDKAMAVIGRAGNGTVVYFENERNFDEYARQARAN